MGASLAPDAQIAAGIDDQLKSVTLINGFGTKLFSPNSVGGDVMSR